MKSRIRLLKIRGEEEKRLDDLVASEAPITIKANGQRIASLLATPSYLSELACGFLASLGLIENFSDISSINALDGEVDVKGNIREGKELLLTSGCGKGFISHPERIKRVNGNFSISPSLILKLISEFQLKSSGFKETGCLHSAAISFKDKILDLKEDIGRHNAIDKVIGGLFLKKEKFSDKAILTSGRITSEIVIKAMNVGIPMIISRSSSTDLAISLADKAGITLVGFARGKRMNVYTHESRVRSQGSRVRGQGSEDRSLAERIRELCKKKNAIILSHNYQPGEVQDVADFLGDSLDLSRRARETSAEIIVFCGVHFMAEIAKILSPEKTVLMPDINAGCPLADMINVEELKRLKKEHPDAIVVSYVNTSALIKAETDYCCTSANGLSVINFLPRNREIIFTPDKWLGDYIARKTKRKLILWNGFCPTHLKIIKKGVLKAKEAHPNAEVIVHPECSQDVVLIADFVLGTGGMIKRVKESKNKEFIIGTETGIIHRLKKENPDKIFYPATELTICPNMKLTTLEKVLWSLEDEVYKIELDTEIMNKARKSIERMLEITS
ncbi:MAG: quinolinate synthase NadA [bacterium]